jgi:transposase
VSDAGPPRRAAEKKTSRAAEQDPAARAAWWAAIAARDPRGFVFVDETSSTRAMSRRRARAPRGARAVGVIPRNYGQATTLVSALGVEGITAAMTRAGALDGPACTAFVEQVLCPTLRPGQTVVLDNLSAHKGKAARAALEAVGCELLFLPAYSPDFNPIELAIARVKEALRSAAARTQEALETAIGEALDRVTPDHARAWFNHCGYRLSAQT